MNPSLKDLAVRVFSEVFEDFTFLFGDPVPAEELPGLRGPCVMASLPFSGPVSGAVELGVPLPLAMEIAASTLGKEAGDPELAGKAQDAVREVASVLGGHLASTFAGRDADLTLSPPRLAPLGASDWERLQTDPETLCFRVNSYPVLYRVELRWEGEAR